MQKSSRLKRELKQLIESPSNGISCWTVGDKSDQFEASIIGQDETPYAGGIFKLSIAIPDRYPFEPPQVQFTTPVYHPNIDTAGRICLDILKMPPKGAWKPAHNISTLLKSVQILLADPNPDDPLMAEISSEYKSNRTLFNKKAKEWTKKYATDTPLKPYCNTSDKEANQFGNDNNCDQKQSLKRPSERQEDSVGLKVKKI